MPSFPPDEGLRRRCRCAQDRGRSRGLIGCGSCCCCCCCCCCVCVCAVREGGQLAAGAHSIDLVAPGWWCVPWLLLQLNVSIRRASWGGTRSSGSSSSSSSSSSSGLRCAAHPGHGLTSQRCLRSRSRHNLSSPMYFSWAIGCHWMSLLP